MNYRYVDKRKRLLPDFIILYGSMIVTLNSYFVKQRDNDTMSLSVFIEPWRASERRRVLVSKPLYKNFSVTSYEHPK